MNKNNIFVVFALTTAMSFSANAQTYNQAPSTSNQPAWQSNDPKYQPWTNQQNNQTTNPQTNSNVQSQQVGPGKPSGGCLKYGSAGALGGHVAGHGVLGALGGCITGAYVKHKSKQRFQETGHY